MQLAKRCWTTQSCREPHSGVLRMRSRPQISLDRMFEKPRCFHIRENNHVADNHVLSGTWSSKDVTARLKEKVVSRRVSGRFASYVGGIHRGGARDRRSSTRGAAHLLKLRHAPFSVAASLLGLTLSASLPSRPTPRAPLSWPRSCRKRRPGFASSEKQNSPPPWREGLNPPHGEDGVGGGGLVVGLLAGTCGPHPPPF